MAVLVLGVSLTVRGSRVHRSLQVGERRREASGVRHRRMRGHDPDRPALIAWVTTQMMDLAQGTSAALRR